MNLALGLAAIGVSTGLLDADIYGPSMPRMLDVKEKPESIDGKRLKPIERYGLKTMSIGYIVDEDTPMIWRGPMVSSALEQMLRDVEWGELDVLVVDMPPGTGDAQLTLAQRVALPGAVIVSTPQDIALIDARKGLNMFRKVAVPVLGIVENMSFFLCPHCGERAEIFGHGGAREEAEKLGVPFLGEVPLHLDIRTTSDQGHPIVVSQPDSPHAQIYKNIAGRVWKQLSVNQRGAARRAAHRGALTPAVGAAFTIRASVYLGPRASPPAHDVGCGSPRSGRSARRRRRAPIPACETCMPASSAVVPALVALPLSDHAVHADHRAGDQLERQEAALLDPAGKLDVERQIAAEAELVVVLGIADQDDAAVAQHARLRHRVPHQRLAVAQPAQLRARWRAAPAGWPASAR